MRNVSFYLLQYKEKERSLSICNFIFVRFGLFQVKNIHETG